jgi:hypothetical protein
MHNEYGMTACEGCARRQIPVYTDDDYDKAVRLALNDNPKQPLLILSRKYDEDKDLFKVRLRDITGEYDTFRLEGKFVRSCLKAVADKGVTAWVKQK